MNRAIDTLRHRYCQFLLVLCLVLPAALLTGCSDDGQDITGIQLAPDAPKANVFFDPAEVVEASPDGSARTEFVDVDGVVHYRAEKLYQPGTATRMRIHGKLWFVARAGSPAEPTLITIDAYAKEVPGGHCE